MFPNFESHFKADGITSESEAGTEADSSSGQGAPDLEDVLLRFGGWSFNQGLYRVMTPAIQTSAQNFISTAFPSFRTTAVPFAYDWLGRVFAVETNELRLDIEGPTVLMFEPGTGEVHEMPADLEEFHESELVMHMDGVLAAEAHQQWLKAGNDALGLNQCAGYMSLLFLGGTDTLDNISTMELGEYWELSGGLIASVSGREG
ncbi:MAG: DUF1851 domain-containing protein [Bdellovibrionota bacterium]